MTLESFKQSVAADPEPPEELPDLLKALWCARRGRWHEAHELVQDESSSLASWIHAHLHLIEGDLENAAYWYRLARREASDASRIDSEWETIAAEVVEALA
ncbi:MAG: hypothetical protein JNK37_16900 [Verrucomicrobiales bacterium]|nr:hypothetical protein [Verrucomicrobiales bacterium]